MQITRTTKVEDLPILLTVKEAATFLGLSCSTVYAMIESERLPCKKFGGKLIRIPRETFETI